jgi:4-hydroxyphenylpyruvate dioxygenase
MKTSIATVSLGGTLREKLEAVAAAGFDGVEIFETDILTHTGSPAEVGAMVRDLGLEIVAFQPFRDFEGMPEPRRTKGFDRARRKFALMNDLGTENILVCSNVSPQALGGIDRAAEDLRELGEIAEGFGVTVGFEALAWGIHIRDYRDAWEVVRRADHPRVGIILDSFHTLVPGYPLDPIRSIPADRITFVQVADAPRIAMDTLQLSRHFRCFPGQGELDIAGFMDALAVTGYDGWLSHEIFNDRFRMASPRQIARDGERSLIAMTDRTATGATVPPATPLTGVAFIEFASSEADAASLERCFRALGFRKAGDHRSKDVTWWRQGDINLVINTETEGFAHAHYITHGTSVAAIGLTVDDADAQMNRAEALLAAAFRQAVGPGELEIPAVRGVGGTLLYFLDGGETLGKVWEVEFRATDEPAGAGTGLTRIDHIAQSVTYDEMPSWRLFYRAILDLEKAPLVDVVDPAGLVESEVLHTADRAVQIVLNASQARRTQSNRFIAEYFGSGVQHIAFEAADIFAAVGAMRAAGLALLEIPGNYYDDLEARFDLDDDLAARLRALNILYDEDEAGRYFQVYTHLLADRFFFEVVAREGYGGMGAPNAPIRLAAQSRLAATPGMPRR